MRTLFILLALLVSSIQMATVGAQVVSDVEIEKRTSASADSDPKLADDRNNNRLAPYFVRLHLIRHGETQANVQNVVLGQGDSPLTENGLAVAHLAAASDDINGKGLRYWRTYCSDLYRAHRTARIVLCLEDEDGNSIASPDSENDLIVDARLRELAKGAREGYLKKLSYEEAIAERSREATLSGNNPKIDVPKLESIDEGWERAKSWIDSIVRDASYDYYSSNESNEERKDGQDSNSCNENERESERKRYDVFALSHSALIRTMIHKMVDAELPSTHATTREGSLSIPNLSRTIIDIQAYESHPSKNHDAPNPRWTPSLVHLTDVSHLHHATNNGNAPYL